MVPRTDFHSRNLGTGRPTIQCTACGEYSHWGRECPYDNFCTTCNNHDHATHMCRAPKQTPQQSPAICMYCGSTEHSSTQCHNRPWDNREQPHIMVEAHTNKEFQCANGEILRNTGFQSSNTQGRASQPHSHRSTVKFWATPVLTDQIITIVLSFLGEIRTTTVTKEGTHRQVLADTPLESNNRINMLIILVQISGIMGTNREDQHSPMLGLMRDTISNTLHPYTHPHLH